MSTILQLVQRTFNRGQKEFEFTLHESTEGTLVLHEAPDGFIDEGAVIYARHKFYHTVLRKTPKNEYTFYKAGRDFLKNVYERTGIDSVVTMTVRRLNKANYQYEDYPSANKVDFSTYLINEIGVSVQMIDTQFNEKVLNRDSTEVDLLKLESIEGLTLLPFTVNEFLVPDTSVTQNGELIQNAGLFITNLTHTVPIIINGVPDFSEVQTPSITVPNIGTRAGSYFNFSLQPRILTVQVVIEAAYIGTGSVLDFSLEVFIRHINAAGATLNQYGVGVEEVMSETSASFSFDKTQKITIFPGESLCLIGIINHTNQKFNYSVADVSIGETFEGTPERETFGILLYEAMNRNLQMISDTPNPLKSAFCGRTDSDLTSYGSDGPGSLNAITRGIFYRENTNITATIPTNWIKFFQSIDSIYNIGMSIEQIGGVSKVVVENLDFFLDNTVVIDLSDGRIREQDIEKRVIPERFFKTAQHGYKKYDYDKSAGLLEFNTKSIWTTVIQSGKSDNKKISDIRGDGQGIRNLVNAPFSVDEDGNSNYDPTKDVKGDDDLFINNLVRAGGGFTLRTNEGFISIKGAVYADSSFNIMLSPKRNALRHGTAYYAALIKSISTDMRWQSNDKNSTLSSQLATESSPVVENADIAAVDLPPSRWLNEEYNFESTITTAELNAFDANRHGLIKLSATKYGWVNEFKPNTSDQKASFSLLVCNLAVVTPSI